MITIFDDFRQNNNLSHEPSETFSPNFFSVRVSALLDPQPPENAEDPDPRSVGNDPVQENGRLSEKMQTVTNSYYLRGIISFTPGHRG
jgi:hypothetical protein